MGRPVTRTVSGATGASGVVALNTLNPRADWLGRHCVDGAG
jgi:hypothetical protein